MHIQHSINIYWLRPLCSEASDWSAAGSAWLWLADKYWGPAWHLHDNWDGTSGLWVMVMNSPGKAAQVLHLFIMTQCKFAFASVRHLNYSVSYSLYISTLIAVAHRFIMIYMGLLPPLRVPGNVRHCGQSVQCLGLPLKRKSKQQTETRDLTLAQGVKFATFQEGFCEFILVITSPAPPARWCFTNIYLENRNPTTTQTGKHYPRLRRLYRVVIN